MQIRLGVLGVMTEAYSISFLASLRNIHSDLRRYRATENRSYIVLLVTSPGMIASAYYRIGHWLWYTQGVPLILLYLLRPFYLLGKRAIELYSGISLSQHAKIGHSFYIENFGSVYVGPCIIGDNCSVAQEVSVGLSSDPYSSDIPVLGDRVFMGAGAKVVDPVSVGNDVAIGANAVVMTDLDDYAVAAGVPAKIISHRGSFDFIQYATMESDPKRVLSLLERDRLKPVTNDAFNTVR